MVTSSRQLLKDLPLKRFMLLILFLASTDLLLSGCSEKKPTSVTEGVTPSAIEQYQANEKKLNEESEASMKEDDKE